MAVGIKVLLRRYGVELEDIDRIFLAVWGGSRASKTKLFTRFYRLVRSCAV